MIPDDFGNWIILDEVQKVPALLNEVHRLIENKGYKFILTGSSARSLKRKGVNLLAGRALTYDMYPLTAIELGKDFQLEQILKFGCLAAIFQEPDPKKYLESYVKTYLREEVLQEGLTRNVSDFARFLEIASFSQGSQINMSSIAREASVHQKVVTSYFNILEDLLLSYRLPAFTKRAKRRVTTHPKFYYFDVGVYRSLRPMGPLDASEEVGGIAVESLFLQQLRAINDYLQLGYKLYFWRTANGLEVDFVVYGEKGLHAFEIKHSKRVDSRAFNGLKAFKQDYPMANLYFIYCGSHREYHKDIQVIPIKETLMKLPEIIG
jgi:predicted AAA+ superfamily ATPase